jgi:hypothetical protein
MLPPCLPETSLSVRCGHRHIWRKTCQMDLDPNIPSSGQSIRKGVTRIFFSRLHPNGTLPPCLPKRDLSVGCGQRAFLKGMWRRTCQMDLDANLPMTDISSMAIGSTGSCGYLDFPPYLFSWYVYHEVPYQSSRKHRSAEPPDAFNDE